MRMLYFSDTHFITPSAEAVFIMKMADAWTANGHDVEVFAHVRSGSAEEIHAYYGTRGGFPVHSYGYTRLPGGKRLLRLFRGWRAARRPCSADLVYGRCPYAVMSAAGSGLPLVLEQHTPPANPAKARVLERLFRHPDFRRLVVITQALQEDYLDRFRGILPADRVLVAHDGADPMEALPPPPNEVRLRFGYVGSLLPGKGWETVVELARRFPEHDFHLVGGGEAELAALRARGVPANLHLHGHVPHSGIPQRLSGFDVALLPPLERVIISTGEDIGRWMSPMKLFEYMAAGRPVIASDLPVIREVLTHGVNGWICPPGDVDAWAAAVRRLAADPALRERLAARAREDFLARYTWRERARRVLEGLDTAA